MATDFYLVVFNYEEWPVGLQNGPGVVYIYIYIHSSPVALHQFSVNLTRTAGWFFWITLACQALKVKVWRGPKAAVLGGWAAPNGVAAPLPHHWLAMGGAWVDLLAI